MNLLQSLFGPPMPTVTPLELDAKLKGPSPKRPLLIDVRQPEEFRSGHIPGARLIPLGELGQRLQELPKNKEIICVCASGSRSRSATKMLIKQGYNAFDMSGGMMTWVRAKMAVTTGK
jgi:rhodanese-related sulfurtransferase